MFYHRFDINRCKYLYVPTAASQKAQLQPCAFRDIPPIVFTSHVRLVHVPQYE